MKKPHRLRTKWAACALSALALTLTLAPHGAQAALASNTEAHYTSASVSAQEQSAGNLLNSDRARYGLSALTIDPVLSRDELAVYNAGAVLDPLVTRYQELIAGCNRLVFIFPIWWNDVPAMLKGWLDKVLLAGFAWEATGAGLKGTLGYIESTEVYTASSNPTEFICEHTGDAIQRMFIEGTLWQLGIERGTWENFGGMDLSTREEREAFLKRLAGR